jgi:hypothetical protein
MKTVNKSYQQIANIAIVQFETLTDDGFGFLPAGPAIEAGDLVIKELDHSGDVNNLLAINNTGNHYLLTDMDLLKGAKQNRVVNISVLVHPRTRKKISVSCVERSRWRYDTPDFKPGKRSMDANSRSKKIESLKSDMKKETNITQREVWKNIHIQLSINAVYSPTEDYNEIHNESEKRRKKNLAFKKSNSSNGIAVFDGKELVCFDLFGNRPSYAYYFDLLEKDALDRIRDENPDQPADQTEAFYKLARFLHQFESNLEEQAEPAIPPASKLKWSGIESVPGFALEYEDNLVHMAGFSK